MYKKSKKNNDCSILNESPNAILSARKTMNMDDIRNEKKTGKNNNIIVVGSSEKKLTENYIIPNVLQANASYVISDTDGTILEKCGKFLEKQGYNIKILNLRDVSESMCYNPLAYIETHQDILDITDMLIDIMKSEYTGEDSFLENSVRLLLNAMLFYLYGYCPKYERNLFTLTALLEEADIGNRGLWSKSCLDIRFNALSKVDPQSQALRCYQAFSFTSEKTAQSTISYCHSYFTRLMLPDLKEMLSSCQLELSKLGQEKTALFVINSETSSVRDSLSKIMYSQLFSLLSKQADMSYGGHLSVPVRIFMTDFNNSGYIKDFPQIHANLHRRWISTDIILQNEYLLSNLYGDNFADMIIENTYTYIFLGTTDRLLAQRIQQRIGKKKVSQILRLIEQNKCIVIQGGKVSVDYKYQYIKKHPNSQYISNALQFDIAEYVRLFRPVTTNTNIPEKEPSFISPTTLTKEMEPLHAEMMDIDDLFDAEINIAKHMDNSTKDLINDVPTDIPCDIDEAETCAVTGEIEANE